MGEQGSASHLPLPNSDKAPGIDLVLRSKANNLADFLLDAHDAKETWTDTANRLNELLADFEGLSASREAVRRWTQHYLDAAAAEGAAA